METLQYSIGVGKYNNSLLLSRKGRNRINSPKPIVFRQALCFSSIRFKNFPSSSLNFSNLRCSVVAADHGHHHHHEEDHNHDRHHHHHHHCGDCGGGSSELAAAQKAVLRFAKAVKWTDLANFLREHLYMCCGSTALLLAAAVCPHLLPKTVAKPLQNAFILVAFPLVGVSAALDALIDISGGKVNIHVLMALAAFASVFMGNALEGGLLLATFNLAHTVEEYFTSRSMIDVKELKENHPESALVLDMNEDRLPNTTDLHTKGFLYII